MEDQAQDPNSPQRHGTERSSSNIEPVRSRWSPKPEQILILESIFNSGMVNPPKEETIKIRKLLEKFGSVGDANVFYWFQNRRSRSRRRQRQIQAAAGEQQAIRTSTATHGGGGAIQYETSSGYCGLGFGPSSPSNFMPSSSSNCLLGLSSSSSSSSSSPCGGLVGGDGVDNLFSFSGQIGLQETEQGSNMSSMLGPLDTSNLHYQSGLITVFINGIPTEVPRGPIDMKAMFGVDVVLVHSSGVAVPFNEYGFSLQSLHLGESYFLVSRPT